jgi:hypothetical protein
VSILFTICALIVLAVGFVVFFGAPYVPSKRRELERALDELYPIGKDDVLVDVGSGDGVVLRAAAERGARAIGYELNPIFVVLSRWLSRRFSGVSVRLANMWRVRFPSETTVVYAFAVSRDSAKLTRKMQKEATRLDRPLLLMTYGCKMPGMVPLRTQGAHLLYEFHPLQRPQAQV